MTFRTQLAIPACLLLAGCVTPAEKPSVPSACSFEQVWNTSVVTLGDLLGDLQIQSINKAAGALETKWLEVKGTTQTGIMQRDINKERVKYVVEVKGDGAGTVATVLQLREEWSPMGVRSRQWRAIPGNSSEESAVAAEIARRLKEKGC